MGASNGPILTMKIIVSAPTIIGGADYQPAVYPQEVPDALARHMIEIGNATAYETKIVERMEVKSEKKPIEPSFASPPDQASQEPTVRPRRGRKPKSL